MSAMADGGTSMEDIGRRIVALRESMNLTGTQFAARMDLTPQQLSNWEKGTKRPEVSAAIRVCGRTGATLDWIYRGERAGLPLSLLNALPDLSEELAKQA